MKKTVKIVALLTVLLVASQTHFVWAIELIDETHQNRTAVELSAVNYGHVPLTDTEIKIAWPSLPTAKQVYTEGECLIYDSRYSGKQASSMNDELPDLNSPTIIPMSSLVSNYTSSDIGGLNGEITTNSAHIWLQYNTSIWVMVPQKYLENPQKSSLVTTK